MTTAERLQGYYDFSPEVLEEVGLFGDRQREYPTYQDFFAELGIEGTKTVQYDGYLSSKILDIRPKDHDDNEAIMVRLPMASALYPSQIYQVATIAATNPNSRVVAFANPSRRGRYDAGLLTTSQLKVVSRGDFRPVVEPSFRFADEQKITKVYEIGTSYGVDLATTAAANANYEVNRLVCIEPASVKKRFPLKLVIDFKSSEAAFSQYVEANNLPTLHAAFKDSVGGTDYALGLLRPTNLAVGLGISRGLFKEVMATALNHQENMQASVVWGSESELATDGIVIAIVDYLQAAYGAERVRALRLPGQKHALADDVHLQAALVLEALRS